MSDTGVNDELLVVGQVTCGVAGQGLVDNSHNLEHGALPHRKPAQLAEHRRDTIMSPGARQFVGDAVEQRVTVVQATDNKCLDHHLRDAEVLT